MLRPARWDDRVRVPWQIASYEEEETEKRRPPIDHVMPDYKPFIDFDASCHV